MTGVDWWEKGRGADLSSILSVLIATPPDVATPSKTAPLNHFVTPAISPSPSIAPAISRLPSVTPTISPSLSVTSSIFPSPTVTSAISPSPIVSLAISHLPVDICHSP